jgi:hypothetical protein
MEGFVMILWHECMVWGLWGVHLDFLGGLGLHEMVSDTNSWRLR